MKTKTMTIRIPVALHADLDVVSTLRRTPFQRFSEHILTEWLSLNLTKVEKAALEAARNIEPKGGV